MGRADFGAIFISETKSSCSALGAEKWPGFLYTMSGLFKSSLCRHFQNTGKCERAESCARFVNQASLNPMTEKGFFSAVFLLTVKASFVLEAGRLVLQIEGYPVGKGSSGCAIITKNTPVVAQRAINARLLTALTS